MVWGDNDNDDDYGEGDGEEIVCRVRVMKLYAISGKDEVSRNAPFMKESVFGTRKFES